MNRTLSFTLTIFALFLSLGLSVALIVIKTPAENSRALQAQAMKQLKASQNPKISDQGRLHLLSLSADNLKHALSLQPYDASLWMQYSVAARIRHMHSPEEALPGLSSYERASAIAQKLRPRQSHNIAREVDMLSQYYGAQQSITSKRKPEP